MHIRNVLLIFIFTNLLGQNLLDNVPVLYYNDRLDELRDILPDLVKDQPEHPSVLFLNGLFALDAGTALSFYKRVYNEYPQSEFADDSMFKTGQYYYSIGDYTLARNAFSLFIARYPNSSLIDRVQYLFCTTIYAQGKTDSARIFLSAFVKNVNSSPFSELAILDLENDALWESLKQSFAVTTPITDEDSEFKYTIQIGAFSIKDNALRVQEKFQSDHFVEIMPKVVRNRTFYAVWIGQFMDRASAEKYAATYFDSYNIDFKIIKR